MAHVRHGFPKMQGETNAGWCILYTGTSSFDTGISSYCKPVVYVGLCGALVRLFDRRRSLTTSRRHELRLVRSGTVGLTIKVRIPPCGVNDVNLVKRKGS